MPSSSFDSNATVRVAFEALNAGNARKAREAFEQVVVAGGADAAVHAALWDPLESTCRHASLSIL